MLGPRTTAQAEPLLGGHHAGRELKQVHRQKTRGEALTAQDRRGTGWSPGPSPSSRLAATQPHDRAQARATTLFLDHRGAQD